MKTLIASLAALLLAAPALAADDAPAAAPSIEDFVRHAAYSAAKLSPGGEYLAMTVDRGDQDVLVVLRTRELEVVKLNQLPDEKSVGSFYWTSSDRLLFNAVRKVGSYAAPFNTGEWFGVDADGGRPRALVHYGPRGATERGKSIGQARFNLLDTLPEDERHVLMEVTTPRSSTGVNTEVVELDTLTGRFVTKARAPRENCSFALDVERKPRFAVCFDSENEEGEYDSETELYKSVDGDWQLLNSSKSTGIRLDVAGTSADGRIYALRSENGGTAAFGTLDMASGKFTSLFHDPVSEPMLLRGSDDRTVIGVVTQAGAPKVTLLDEEHPDVALYGSLAGAFPGQFVDFSSATSDGRQVIVSVSSDRNPGELYLFDRESGKARFLMKSRQWLEPERMAKVKPFSFTSRDGLVLHGYLTIPHGSSGKNLPMIVNPHGGPMGPRDDWFFNGEAQLLASRGYLVMQVNFRGSGGFGKAFQDKAYGQWADGIMNDVIDATRWAIEKGHADGGRVCIYGGSFGGFAAMMAPVKAPGLYQCAFGYVGFYDAQVQLTESDTSESEAGRRYMARSFGATREEQDAVSPVTHAASIKLPVFLAAGARDPRCPPQQTRNMYAALKSAGNTPEGMIIQDGEMHGFYEEESNLKLYTQMLAFFDRHIGRRKAAAADTTAGTNAD